MEMKPRLEPRCKSLLGGAPRRLEEWEGAAVARAEGKEQQNSSTSVQRGQGAALSPCRG